MKLSVFTTATSPKYRGDNLVDALKCYEELADEVVVVNGKINNEIKFNDVVKNWPREFDWSFIGQQFQRGYEACTGDWVIHADLDFIFHEQDFDQIREACMNNNQHPAVSFWKYQFIQPDRYRIKSRLIIAVNKGVYGDRIKFNGSGDLCQPTLDGKDLRPSGLPEARIPFYNYEKLIKTEAQIKDDAGRMARAWQRHFGEYKLGGPDDESAYQKWLEMNIGRYHKPQIKIKLEEHPKFIQETVKNLTPEMWGHSAFGLLKENNYAQD